MGDFVPLLPVPANLRLWARPKMPQKCARLGPRAFFGPAKRAEHYSPGRKPGGIKLCQPNESPQGTAPNRIHQVYLFGQASSLHFSQSNDINQDNRLLFLTITIYLHFYKFAECFSTSTNGALPCGQASSLPAADRLGTREICGLTWAKPDFGL